MDIKWQKNVHCIIKSHGLLRIDNDQNVRRASFLGRIWFIIKDFLTNGKETVKLNFALMATIGEVSRCLTETQYQLNLALSQVPNHENLLRENDGENLVIKNTRREVIQLINNNLILRGKSAVGLFGIPNYNYLTDCLRDLPNRIREHSQANEIVKNSPHLTDIERFFNLDFIRENHKRQLVQIEIDRGAKDWAG